MNTDTIANDIVNALISKLADAVTAKVTENIGTIIDDKIKLLLKSDRFHDAVVDHIDVSSIVDEVEGNLDIESTVRNCVNDLDFTISVR